MPRNTAALFDESVFGDAGTEAGKPRKPGNTRVTGKEQYYTPTATAEHVFDLIAAVDPDWIDRPFLEPAGGTGTIIDVAARRGAKTILSWDIEPKHGLVRKGNFLEQPLTFKGGCCATNPPFGRNNALSIPFFNHAASACDIIAFIVPRSWRKWSVQNKLHRSFHLVADEELTINYLNDKGEDAHAFDKLRTCIQVWKRSAHLRQIMTVHDHRLIEKTTPAEADVSLTIFGYGCGTSRKEFDRRKKNTTQMYLKLHHPNAWDALQKVDFSRFYMNTAYTEALSIQEINYLLNEEIFGDPGIVQDLL